MAKVKIKHEGKTVTIDLDGSYTESEIELLKRLGIIEDVVEEKPKRKKMSDKHRTTEYYKNVDNTENDGEA